MARPKKAIDPEQVRKLAAIACTVDDIALVMDCDKRTLERRFAATIEKGRSEGRASLRRKQWEMAMGGHPTMLIWLGKQLLGQKDQAQVQQDGTQAIRVIRTSAPARLNGVEIRSNGNGHVHVADRGADG